MKPAGILVLRVFLFLSAVSMATIWHRLREPLRYKKTSLSLYVYPPFPFFFYISIPVILRYSPISFCNFPPLFAAEFSAIFCFFFAMVFLVKPKLRRKL